MTLMRLFGRTWDAFKNKEPYFFVFLFRKISLKLGERSFIAFYDRFYADYTFEIVKICSWVVNFLQSGIQVIDFNS